MLTNKDILISVISDGRRFNVRLVRIGERYGRDLCLTHESKFNFGDDPLVEFYDARYPHCGEIGQFVSRYYRSTLMEKPAPARGLCLDGGVPEWSIDGVAFEMVRRALRMTY